MNHSETIAFTAAPPMTAQPKPVNRVATNNIAGLAAVAQPKHPAIIEAMPAAVTHGKENRRYIQGSRVMKTAPMR